MNGRFGAAIVAFALAAAMSSRAPMLSEFLIQLRDPNVLGGALFGGLLHFFGYAFVLALCSALAGCAVLLASWRTRVRGASDWHATLAASMVALCISGRAGVSLDPIGWLCAAACALLLERDDDRSSTALIAVVALWSLLQGGATLATLLILCAIIGRITDDGIPIDAAFRRRLMFWGVAMLAGIVQAHGLPFPAYGAHVAYLDAVAPGAQRDRVWNGDISAQALGFCSVLVVAAWYGLRRRGRMTDAVTLLTFFVLALIDARNLPYFGIVCAPIAVDALASYYVLARGMPRGSALRYAPAVAACVATFIAVIAATEPKAPMWPVAFNQPAALIATLQREPRAHNVLCTRPRWCDGLPELVKATTVVVDDRTGITPARNLHLEALVANALPGWRRALRPTQIDAVIAARDDSIATLLRSSGWRERASDGTRVLLEGNVRAL